MKKVYLILFVFFAFTNIYLVSDSHAQTPGEIKQGSTGYSGSAAWTYPWTPLDPDGDGWIIDDGDAFLDNYGDTADPTPDSVQGTPPPGSLQADFDDNEREGTGPNDPTLIELNWVAMPQIDIEPDNDPRRGSGCGDSDIVDDPVNGGDAAYVYYYNQPVEGDILLYRLRIAQDAGSASFAYSVLIDTDGLIGDDDPNSIVGNAGFEYEIRYRTGGSEAEQGLHVDDVDGTTTGTQVAKYALGTHDQRSYAALTDSDCSVDPIFFDWWIYLSDIEADIETGVRLVAATSQDGSSVLSNTGADIGGVDDDARIGSGLLFELQDDALDSLIRLQSATPIGNLGAGGCFITDDADIPTINTPIFDSADTLSGTSSEDAGTTINIYRNGTLFASTIVKSDNTWKISNDTLFTLGLRPFDQIVVEVDPQCENATSATAVSVINDLDTDGDGIPDSEESANGVDPGGDADGDNIPNFRDTNYPGYTDENGDGINDLFDQDLDGIPDHFDLDSDNDGIPDSIEAGGSALDADGDGLIDNTTDADNDGIADTAENTPLPVNDTDGDGIPNHLDLDSDDDGIVDLLEAGGTDSNGDGITDAMADANNNGVLDNVDVDFFASNGGSGDDIDGDNIDDSFDAETLETLYMVSGIIADGIPDAFDTDLDNDNIPDSVDVDFSVTFGKTGATGVDTDGDGIDDAFNAPDNGGTDTDGDGIDDSHEGYDFNNDGILDTAQDGTDLDGDGIDDDESSSLTDQDRDGVLDDFDNDFNGDGLDDILLAPLSPPDTDGDGLTNNLDLDSDNDGIGDIIEAQTTSGYIAPSGTDTDGDGLDDSYDTDNAGTAIVPIDTDGALPDYIDDDSDGDGVSDLIEANDADRDGINDLALSGNDIDKDGIDDIFDTDTSIFGPQETNVALQNTDGDTEPDFRDTEDDGDGIITGPESGGLSSDDENRNNNGSWADDFADGGGLVPDYLYDPDFDGDGIIDANDLDSDNDGILDSDEDGGTGIDPTADADGDGTLNYLDPNIAGFTDTIGDGINDAFDTDLDGIPDFQDLDSDGDGIVDLIEAGGTDDGDGIVDSFTDGNSDGIDDTIGTSGLNPPNTDFEGRNNVYDIDSDDDGILDNIEGQTTAGYISPSGIDANRNGIDDAYDSTPLDPSLIDTDTDGDPDYVDFDSDDDGVPDYVEGHDFNRDGYADWDDNKNLSLDEADILTDTDGDGLLDAFDTNNGGTAAVLGDTDGDLVLDFRDTDDDNDTDLTVSSDENNGDVPPIYEQGDYFTFNDGGGDATPSIIGVPDYLFNGDSDGDGILDINDLDSDNDGILDTDEDGGTGLDPTALSGGATNVPNYLDVDGSNDSNGDGIVDAFDADLDGIPDFLDLDSDNDGIYDIVEAGGTDDGDGIVDSFSDGNSDGIDDTIGVSGLGNLDTDGDGVPNSVDLDSDNDGVPDITESGGTDTDGNGRADDNLDSDNDGIVNIFDTDSGNGPLDISSNPDGDGVPAYLDLNSDGDRIFDAIEHGASDADNNGTIDGFADTDGNGLHDPYDPENGGTPLANLDFDGDGLINALDIDSDNDGILDSTEAAPNGDVGVGAVIPINTDGRGNPDYLDLDSDNDGILDIIEGHDDDQDGFADWDTNFNAVVDLEDGGDTDGDGLLNVFEANPAPLPDFDIDTRPDFRDTDDDGDGIPTADEPLDLDGVSGVPDYLEDQLGSCGLGFITREFNGNADQIGAFNGATDRTNILGTGDNLYTELPSNGNFIIVDLTDTIPSGESILISFSSSENKSVTLLATSSLSNSGPFINQGTTNTASSSSTTEVVLTYTISGSNSARWVRLEFSAGNGKELLIDNLSYAFTTCHVDSDNDGVADIDDPDDDNDGIADIIDGNVTGVDPSGDADGDGVLNYLDSDLAECGGIVNGVCSAFDFDGDGIPNHLDLDSDSDGLPDAVEANGGTLPADMQTDGEYSISILNANDANNNGFHNAYDPDTGGDDTFGTLDTDSDGSPDFLDLNSDGDTYPIAGTPAWDYIEANDPVGDDNDALVEYLALADAFEAAYTAANPGMSLNYYPSDTTDAAVDANGNNIPDWLDDNDNDGIPNFMDFGQPSYRDSDGDGIVDLFDPDSFGEASIAGSDYLTTTSAPVTLPLDFLSFTAREVNGRVQLDWVTTNEENVSHFLIERSRNGLDFNTIGELPAVNISSTVNDYQFEDKNPAIGFNYYRVTEIDFDGYSESTEIVFVLIETDESININLYPNPILNNRLTISSNISLAGARYQIINLSGQALVNGRFTSDLQNQTITVNHLNSGLYLIRIEMPDRVFDIKFIKQ